MVRGLGHSHKDALSREHTKAVLVRCSNALLDKVVHRPIKL